MIRSQMITKINISYQMSICSVTKTKTSPISPKNNLPLTNSFSGSDQLNTTKIKKSLSFEVLTLTASIKVWSVTVGLLPQCRQWQNGLEEFTGYLSKQMSLSLVLMKSNSICWECQLRLLSMIICPAIQMAYCCESF
jgi:hypothetical protein